MRNLLAGIAILVVLNVPSWGATSRVRMLRILAEFEIIDRFIGVGRISTVSAGTSVLGQTIPVVVVRNPEVPADQTRRVFVICRQHGDEPASTEAMIAVIRTYFANPSHEDLQLLSRVTLVIVPMMNPDGAARDERRNANNADLNRDWIRQRQPETRAVMKAIELWRPSLIVDAHELDRDDYRGDFIESMGTSGGASRRVAGESAELQRLMISKLRTHGLVVWGNRVVDRSSPRLAHRYFPLKHGIPTLLVETRQAGARAENLAERARMHIISVMTAARCVAGDSSEIRREIATWHKPTRKSF